MESLIVWSLGHWTYLCHLVWCLLSYIILVYCISPKFISGKRFPFCQIIHCKLSIMVIVGTKPHKYLHDIHVSFTIKNLIALVCTIKYNRTLIVYYVNSRLCNWNNSLLTFNSKLTLIVLCATQSRTIRNVL